MIQFLDKFNYIEQYNDYMLRPHSKYVEKFNKFCNRKKSDCQIKLIPINSDFFDYDAFIDFIHYTEPFFYCEKFTNGKFLHTRIYLNKDKNNKNAKYVFDVCFTIR